MYLLVNQGVENFSYVQWMKWTEIAKRCEGKDANLWSLNMEPKLISEYDRQKQCNYPPPFCPLYLKPFTLVFVITATSVLYSPFPSMPFLFV